MTGISSGTTSRVYETWRPTVQAPCLVLWIHKVHHQKLRLKSKFLLESYVLGLCLIEIALGTTSQVYETWRLTVQIRRSVLWGNTVQYQKFKLTSKFLFEFHVLGFYLTGIAPESISRVHKAWRVTVQISHLGFLWENKVLYQTFWLTSKFVFELHVLWLYLTPINSEILICRK